MACAMSCKVSDFVRSLHCDGRWVESDARSSPGCNVWSQGDRCFSTTF